MSLGEHALCGHAQSGNILNLENISMIAIYSGNVPMLIKKAQLNLNNSVHILDMLVFKCTVDINSTISWASITSKALHSRSVISVFFLAGTFDNVDTSSRWTAKVLISVRG